MMQPRQLVDFSHLHDHQKEALRRLVSNDWARSNPAIVSLPTGTGKTAVLIAAPFALGARRVLILAPDLDIFKQLKAELMGEPANAQRMIMYKLRMLPPQAADAARPSVEAVPDTGDINVAQLGARDVVLANVDKFHTRESSRWRERLAPDFFDLVIVDEAHHLPSDKWKVIVEYFGQSGSKLVFLTATPYRGDGKRIVDDLTPPFCNGKLLFHFSIDDAIRAGQIKLPCWHLLSVAAGQLANDPTLRVIRAVADQLAAMNAGRQPQMRYQGMVITDTREDAAGVKQLWDMLGSSATAAVYHGDVEKRALVLHHFKQRQIDVLIVVQMLREGFDHPPVSVIGIARRISSPLLFTQFVGRAFRIIRAADGSAHPDYVQQAHIFAATEHEQQRNWLKFRTEQLIPIEPEPIE
jgi:superfamily II DNA or RNA helicase